MKPFITPSFQLLPFLSIANFSLSLPPPSLSLCLCKCLKSMKNLPNTVPTSKQSTSTSSTRSSSFPSPHSSSPFSPSYSLFGSFSTPQSRSSPSKKLISISSTSQVHPSSIHLFSWLSYPIIQTRKLEFTTMSSYCMHPIRAKRSLLKLQSLRSIKGTKKQTCLAHRWSETSNLWPHPLLMKFNAIRALVNWS